jgi:hypothetical protein
MLPITAGDIIQKNAQDHPGPALGVRKTAIAVQHILSPGPNDHLRHIAQVAKIDEPYDHWYGQADPKY